jgi:hypothetical protein
MTRAFKSSQSDLGQAEFLNGSHTRIRTFLVFYVPDHLDVEALPETCTAKPSIEKLGNFTPVVCPSSRQLANL